MKLMNRALILNEVASVFSRLKEIKKELEKIKLRKMELSSLEYFGIKNVEDELHELDLRSQGLLMERKSIKTDIVFISILVCLTIACIIAGIYVFKFLGDFGVLQTTVGKMGAIWGMIAVIGLSVLTVKAHKRINLRKKCEE